MSKTREQRRQAAKTRDTIYAAVVLIGFFVVACALPNWMDVLVH